MDSHIFFSKVCLLVGNGALVKYLLSILLFAVLSAIPITLILYLISDKSRSECRGGYPAILGILERALYIILVGAELHYVLIGWLALKGLQNPFTRIKDISSCDEKTLNIISDNYHILLTGNSLSLLSGVIGGLIVKNMH